MAPDHVGDEGPPLEDLSDSDDEEESLVWRRRWHTRYGHDAALYMQRTTPP